MLVSELSDQEKQRIFDLASSLVGYNAGHHSKHLVLLNNVEQRMRARGAPNLAAYLQLCHQEPDEHAQLLSGLTIHTTRFFREIWHFEELYRRAFESYKKQQARVRVWSAACSTGQELYSIGLVLETLRRNCPGFEYSLLGSDIDPVSLAEAKRAVYPQFTKSDIPSEYWPLLRNGRGDTEHLFAIPPEIRKRTQLRSLDLRQLDDLERGFDLIFCRNVMIYFPPGTISDVLCKLMGKLTPDGALVLGHCEHVPSDISFVEALGHSCFRLKPQDSAVVSRMEHQEPLLSDRAHPSGARIGRRLQCILVGASTGGTVALSQLLFAMPKDTPPVVVVQHIANDFLQSFARDLARSSGLKLWDGRSPQRLQSGYIYMALEPKHITIRLKSGLHYIEQQSSAPVHSVIPSVDVLFESAAAARLPCTAILLTGMGRDGAEGLLKLRQQGNYTMAQNQESSVVFGMPREAIMRGAVDFIGNIRDIRTELNAHLLPGNRRSKPA